MTSKEALRKVKIKCHPKSVSNDIIDEAIEVIEKDLEVLEILKENIEIVDTDFVDENGDDVFKVQLKPLASSKQRKVKEWLEKRDK